MPRTEDEWVEAIRDAFIAGYDFGREDAFDQRQYGSAKAFEKWQEEQDD